METDVRPVIFMFFGLLTGVCLHAHTGTGNYMAIMLALPCLLCLFSWNAEKHLDS